MKRYINTILVFIILANLAGCDINNKKFIVPNTKYDVFDICVTNNNNILIADKEQILIINKNGKQESKIEEELGFCTVVYENDNKIYAVDNIQNFIKVYSINGETIETIQLPKKILVLELIKIENTIAMLVQSVSNFENVYVAFIDNNNVYHEKQIPVNIHDGEFINGFAKYMSTQFIITSLVPLKGTKLIYFDLIENKIVRTDFIKEDYLYNIVYDESTKRLFGISGNNICLYNFEQNKIETIKEVPKSNITNIFIVENEILYYDVNSNKLHREACNELIN